MNYRKAILGAASVIALTAGVQQSAEASITRGDRPARFVATAGTSQSINSDPLFDLIGRTNGSLSGGSIEAALMDMFINPSQEEIEGFPALLANISGLGVTSEALAKSREALIELALAVSGLDEELRDVIIRRLEAKNPPIVLAQAQKRNRQSAKHHEPEGGGTGTSGAGSTGGTYQ